MFLYKSWEKFLRFLLGQMLDNQRPLSFEQQFSLYFFHVALMAQYST